MQIDFHHATTYVVARLAGFAPNQADTIAYAAQYVDDSTTSGFIQFENGMRYQRHATAHPVLDPNNLLDNDENAISWLPFHFLPGNLGRAVGEPIEGDYLQRLVCLPDSPVARAMMAAVIRSKDTVFGLHRLGIAAHVFADTFSHQHFVGQHHTINGVQDDIVDGEGQALKRLSVPPVGHGQVNTYPDRPFLQWTYTNAQGQEIRRDNAAIFCTAADRLYEEFKRFLYGDPAASVEPMPARTRTQLREMFETVRDEDELVRHHAWLDAIAGDRFGFGKETVTYVGKGTGSWKHQALGDAYTDWLQRSQAAVEAKHPLLEKILSVKGGFGFKEKMEHVADLLGKEISVAYSDAETFLNSDYKKFHDAARAHRHQMFTEILPSFGIWAA